MDHMRQCRSITGLELGTTLYLKTVDLSPIPRAKTQLYENLNRDRRHLPAAEPAFLLPLLLHSPPPHPP